MFTTVQIRYEQIVTVDLIEYIYNGKENVKRYIKALTAHLSNRSFK